jgi:hypothetical protein
LSPHLAPGIKAGVAEVQMLELGESLVREQRTARIKSKGPRKEIKEWTD